MTRTDFQTKFLKIGYSKRSQGKSRSKKGRPFIGRKGIGKLALLSCAEKISVLTKTSQSNYVGGTIDNTGLDDAITNDLTPQQYPLGNVDMRVLTPYIKRHKQGTIIHFQGIKGGIRNSFALLKKIVALYFRFSLQDESFNIFIDGEKITTEHLKDLALKTEFLWNINKLSDPYITQLSKLKESKQLTVRSTDISGFIASVEVPRDLNIMNIEEQVSVDLFVNGRLREKNILKHIPSARIVESYLYGQVHVDKLDDNTKDRFTSDREGVVADDPLYQEFLQQLKEKVLKTIIDDWDVWRRKHREDGDPENSKLTKRERKSVELFNAVADDYELPPENKNRAKVDDWVAQLSSDAQFNFGSYAECFISENLIRNYIADTGIALSPEATSEIEKMQKREIESKNRGNISIPIRKNSGDLSYLDMTYLANLADKPQDPKPACLSRDASEYKPMRDAMAHTALLTDVAKHKLTSVYQNVKERTRTLLVNSKTPETKKSQGK